MKIGIHAYMWCTAWNNDQLYIMDEVKKNGLDFLEIPLMVLEDFDPKAALKKKKEVGIDLVTSNVILAPERDITSKNPEFRRNGIEYLKKCVDATNAIESDCFSGVIYSQYCKANALPTPDDWKWSAEGLHEVGLYAKEKGVTLGLEPVTRYESNLLNTCEQTMHLLDMIGLDNVTVHLDTYHMNVEEKDFYKATKQAKGRLCHYHMCEGDRGTPGTGHVDWDGVFRALKEDSYNGRIGMEGFSGITENMSTWVWRQLSPSPEAYLQEGIQFLKGMIAKYDL